MDLTQIKDRLIGEWTGNNLLRLSWVTPSDYHSSSILSALSIVQAKGLMIKYTWSHEDKAQEGTIMFAYDGKDREKPISAAWMDSWHMSDKIMFCQGKITDQGIDICGSYQAPPGPDWGWRILFNCFSDNELEMLMYNITPDGEEDLAVKALYKRLR